MCGERRGPASPRPRRDAGDRDGIEFGSLNNGNQVTGHPAVRANTLRLGCRTRTRSGQHGTHSMRRIKATMIYRRTRNLRAVQLLPGHAKRESTVRYLGVEVDDALELWEQTEI